MTDRDTLVAEVSRFIEAAVAAYVPPATVVALYRWRSEIRTVPASHVRWHARAIRSVMRRCASDWNMLKEPPTQAPQPPADGPA